MDMITLAMAKAYSDSKGGYTTVLNEIIVPETFATFSYGEFVTTGTMQEGSAYRITVDGKVYEEVCYIATENGFSGMLVCGALDASSPVAMLGISETEVMIIVNADAWEETSTHSVSVSVLTEIVRPIDQKYIPAMDGITLNGTDGKQYKITAANGALKVTEV